MSKTIYTYLLTLLLAILTTACTTTGKRIYNQAVKGTVDIRISDKDTDKRTGIASGFFVNSEGFILTNKHVLKENSHYSIRFNNHKFNAETLGIDPLYDLAILKITSPHWLTSDKNNERLFSPLTLSTTATITPGETVYIYGNQMGEGLTFIRGMISAVRDRQISGIKEDSYQLLQLDAMITPGVSGAPVMLQNSQVIGIVKAAYNVEGKLIPIGYAIPLPQMSKRIDEMITYGKIRKSAVDFEVDNYMSTITGMQIPALLVTAIEEAGTSYKCGLRSGDAIVTIAKNGIVNKNTLTSEITKRLVGDDVELVLVRNNKIKTINIKTIEE